MSLGRHTIANFIGSVVPMIVALFTVPAFLHLIGPERYGVLAIILALLGYFGFFDLGLGRAVTQRMSSLSRSNDIERSNLLWTALTTSFLLGFLGSIVLWISVDFMLGHIMKMSDNARNEAKHAVFLLLIALPLLLPMSALIGALQARLRYFEVNVILIIIGVLGQVLPLIIAFLGYVELMYLLSATLFVRILSIFLLFKQCRTHVPLTGLPLINRVDLKHMINYGGWVSVMSILAPILVTVDRLIIGTLSGARAVASYTVPYDLVTRAMVISGSFSSALFPRLASANQCDAELLAYQSSLTLVSIMTPMIIFGLFVIDPFLQFWVGEDFADSSKGVAEVLMIGVWVNAIVISHYSRFMAKHNPRTIVLIYLFEIPIYLFLLYFAITKYGVVGAAIAWSARGTLDALLLLRLNRVLSITLKAIFPSFMLVAATTLILILQLNIYQKLIITIFLILFSLILDRKIFLSIYRHIKFGHQYGRP